MFLAFDTSASIDDGLTSVLQVSEGSRTVVLLKGTEEVTRFEVEFVPGETQTLRP